MQKKEWSAICVGDEIVWNDTRRKVVDVGASGKTFMCTTDNKFAFEWITADSAAASGAHLEGEEPKWEPEDKTVCYFADPTSKDFFESASFLNDNSYDLHRLKHGLIFSYTEEGRLAAIAKSRLMLGIEE